MFLRDELRAKIEKRTNVIYSSDFNQFSFIYKKKNAPNNNNCQGSMGSRVNYDNSSCERPDLANDFVTVVSKSKVCVKLQSPLEVEVRS